MNTVDIDKGRQIILDGYGSQARNYYESTVASLLNFKYNNPGRVKLGIDVLADMEPVSGAKYGLFTNAPSRAANEEHNFQLLIEAGYDIPIIFAPEHGFESNLAEGLDDGNKKDNVLNLLNSNGVVTKQFPIISASAIDSGAQATIENAITNNQLNYIIYDLQSVGSRHYTYIADLGNVLSACKRKGIRCIVCDRHNMLSPAVQQGNSDVSNTTYNVWKYAIPIRHGATIGYLAEHVLSRNGADLQVVKLENYHDSMYWDDTNIWNGNFYSPSPNIPSFDSALLYPGTCLFEGINMQEGRGVYINSEYIPFQIVGYPSSFFSINGVLTTIQATAHAKFTAGASFTAVQSYTPVPYGGGDDEEPKEPTFNGEVCSGIRITITDKTLINPIHVALVVMFSFRDVLQSDFVVKSNKWINTLWGSDTLMTALNNNTSAVTFINSL